MGRPSLLLVEDDRTVREVLALFLGDAFDVRLASTAAEAVSILEREPVAAVVLDYRLPDRSGLDLLAELRAARPRLPIVMVTGYGSESLCASAFRLGVRDYFPKPVVLQDLLESVRKSLPEDGGELEPADGRANGHWAPASSSAGWLDLPIQKAIKLIQLRYWDDISLSGLARELGMSKYHLSRRFKDVTGTTFRGYLLRTRLERAKALLAAGQRASITEVAHSVGFGDLPRFDKLFKRYTGVTPSAYRAARPASTER
jgi:YesN/AraC family two-component response regulator